MYDRSILIVVGAFKPELAGGSKQTETIIKHLKKVFKFTVLSYSTKLENNIFEKKKIYRIKSHKNFLIIKTIIKTILFFIINRNQFEVVHLRGTSSKNTLILLLSIFLKKKIIYTPTRYQEDDLRTIKSNKKIYFILLKKYALIHCISPIFFTLKNSFVKKNFKFIYIPNLVDTKKFTQKKKSHNKYIKIICVGFFSKIKNQKILYEACKKIYLSKKKSNNFRILFVGNKKFNYYLSDSNTHKYIKNDSIKNKLNNKIKFINYTNQIQTLYKNSDIFILPSLTEGMPNSLLEAMSSGLPCIATNLKNITTNIIKNGKCGFLFKKNDLLDLKVKIEKLLNSEKLRQKIGKEARKKIYKDYSIERNITKYKNLYIN